MEYDEKYPYALPQGTVLDGRYILKRVLGQGGFGITYQAEEHGTGEQTAIKEYFPDALAFRSGAITVAPYSGEREQEFLDGKQYFLEEARTLARFRGEAHIVQIRSYFEENGTAYFVMDYVDGESLQEYIRERGGSLGWEETKELLLPVMDALSIVHERGLIHRDVAPDNIFLTGDGPKLLDFGAARNSLEDRSQSMDVVLKHGYAPREQYSRNGRQGSYTDVYSMAATVYFVLTGQTPPDSVERLREDEIILPSSLGAQIPAGSEDALMKGMAVQPEERFQTMREFKEALLKGESPDGREEKLRWSRGKWSGYLTTAAAVLIFIVGISAGRTEQEGVFVDWKLYTKGAYSYELKGAEAEIQQYSGTESEVLIPETLGGSPVTSIGSNAFMENSEMTSVTVPEGVRSIGEMAFCVCESLASVSLPEGLEVIEENAFIACEGLTEIRIPDSVFLIESGAFIYCIGLTEIELPDSVRWLGSSAFENCGGLERVALSASLTAIDDGTFQGCTSLTEVVIPDNVKRIGASAFYGCENLMYVSIPADCVISDSAFWGCDQVQIEIRGNSDA